MTEFSTIFDDLESKTLKLYWDIKDLRKLNEKVTFNYQTLLTMLSATDYDTAVEAIIELKRAANSAMCVEDEDLLARVSLEADQKKNRTYREAAGI